MLRGYAITAPKDRYLNTTRNLVDKLPVRHALVGLLRGPTVHGDGGGAGVLHHACHQGCVDRLFVPSRAHLDRDWHPNGVGHRPDDRRCVGGLTHEAAPGVVLGDLADRTPHVDVDNVGAHRLDNLRRG